MKSAIVPLAILVALFGASGSSGRPNGNPTFNFVCALGKKQAAIATENGFLVYRFGTPRNTELVIHQSRTQPNVFYRYDSLGPSGGGQQLRFVSGDYSYGIASWFFAGPRGGEGVGFFVTHGNTLLRWKRCGESAWLTEDHRLDRLPSDTLDTVVILKGLPR